MPGEGVLLDSVILIDHFNGVAAATEYLRQSAGRVYVSPITRAEVLTGFDGPELEIACALLDLIPLLPIDLESADLAARLRRERRWRLPDAVQAALAIQHGLRLVTRNTRDFDPDRETFVLIPYRL